MQSRKKDLSSEENTGTKVEVRVVPRNVFFNAENPQ